ncbi:SUMF1/EgtB/PvdO family nonheme iron enzyme [Candidatus Poribacteria bacterium]|nr:SUMF1/EgtB/PvdO family nonheme iron enzyme [Candidatus Poribacteria bacterium]
MDLSLLDVYEVTNAQYRKFVQATGHPEPKEYGIVNGVVTDSFEPWKDSRFNAPNQPVVCVSWYDAAAYCQWAGKRLPTEAEWEKAARGGLVGNRYPWGDEAPDGIQCNFADKNTDFSWSDKNADDGYQYAAPVGKYAPNGYGTYDMAGNVWEWCMDEYDSGFYAKSPKNKLIIISQMLKLFARCAAVVGASLPPPFAWRPASPSPTR